MTARKLAALFSIEPGEGGPVLMMLAVSFLIGGSTTLIAPAAYALFLAEFGAQGLPYVYMAMSLVISACSVAYLRLSDHLSLPRLLVVAVSSILLLIAGMRLGLSLSAGLWLTFALPIASELATSFSLFAFWGLAARLFSLHQGKRLFGLIGGGWAAAKAGSGFLIPVLVFWIGTPNLLIAAVAGIACALPLILHLARTCAAPPSDRADKAPVAGPRPRRAWWKNRYVLLVLALYGSLMLAWATLDVVFYDQANLHFAGEERLAGFLGLFLGIVGLLNLLSHSALTAPVLKRLGIRGGLLLTPLILFATGVLAAGVGAAFGAVVAFFLLVAATRLLVECLSNSVDFPVINILYQPLPPDQRLKTQALVDGVAYSVSVGLSGVGLWALTLFWKPGPVQLWFVVLLLVAAWAVVALLLGREYPGQLRQALAKRRLGSAPLISIDGATRAILQQELSSPSPGVVSYALTTLELEGREYVARCLPALLDHPTPEVRQDALGHMERLGMTGSAAAVRKLLVLEPSPVVRGTALCTLCALEGTGAYEYVSSFLRDRSPEVRQGAMVGLLRHGGIEGVLAAGNQLLQMATASEASERMHAAQVLGEVGAEGFYSPLLPLLRDEVLEVRKAALRAAGQIKSERLWSFVVEALGAPHLRGPAASALVAGGDAAIPALFAGFAESAAQPRLQRRLASVAGRIGGPQVVAWLKECMAHADGGVRTQVLQALSHCRYQAAPAEAGQVVEQIKAEATLAARILAAQTDIGQDDSADLLQGALTYLLAECRTRIFSLLTFLYDRPTILQARDNLSLPSADRRAYALEVLDVLVSSDRRKWFFPLLSDLPAEEKSRRMGALFPQAALSRQQRLEEIITNPADQFSAWTQACALYAAGRSPAMAPARAVRNAAAAADPVVHEIALWAAARLESSRSEGQSDQAGQDSDHRPGEAARYRSRNGEERMLTTVEKVIALKRAAVFAQVPDEALAELAPCMEEVEYGAGQTVFEKGDLGRCMYLIADGGVRIHDGDRTLDDLHTGEVFGEMAALDAEPRSASATACVDTLLLRLDQEPLYEIMEDRIEVARGIIRTLSGHLRARLSDLSRLRQGDR